MLEIFGKSYYIDLDQIVETCRFNTSEEVKLDDDGSPVIEVNIFKYETIKVCIERLLGEYESVDDENIQSIAEKNVSPSFKIAHNTLLKYNILKDDEGEF